jgi:hypothetical protein
MRYSANVGVQPHHTALLIETADMRPLILLRYTLQAALVAYCIGHLIYLSLAHADERSIVAGCSAGPDPSCGLFRRLTPDEFETDEQRWLHRYTIHPQHCRLVTSPDDGLVSGPTPRVCARPEAPHYPPGAGRGLLDPRQPERSFAR